MTADHEALPARLRSHAADQSVWGCPGGNDMELAAERDALADVVRMVVHAVNIPKGKTPAVWVNKGWRFLTPEQAAVVRKVLGDE